MTLLCVIRSVNHGKYKLSYHYFERDNTVLLLYITVEFRSIFELKLS